MKKSFAALLVIFVSGILNAATSDIALKNLIPVNPNQRQTYMLTGHTDSNLVCQVAVTTSPTIGVYMVAGIEGKKWDAFAADGSQSQVGGAPNSYYSFSPLRLDEPSVNKVQRIADEADVAIYFVSGLSGFKIVDGVTYTNLDYKVVVNSTVPGVNLADAIATNSLSFTFHEYAPNRWMNCKIESFVELK